MDFKRTYLVAEAALIAGLIRDTLRVWLRRDYFDFDRPDGWKRFTFLEVMAISVFAEVVRRTKDHELAKQIAKIEFENWIGPENLPANDCFVEFWRDDQERLWVEQITGEDRMSGVAENQVRGEIRDVICYGIVSLSEIRNRTLARMTAFAEGRLGEDGKVKE